MLEFLQRRNSMADKVVRNSDLKHENKLSILRILRDEITSRIDISTKLNLSKSTVSSIIEDLMKNNLVVETGVGQSTEQGGKRPRTLKLNNKAAMIAAVYFSYNLIEVALTDLTGNILIKTSKKNSGIKDIEKECITVSREVKKLQAKLEKKEIDYPLIAIGVVVKSLIDAEQGVLSYSATLPGFEDVPIAKYFERGLCVPCFVENDVRGITVLEYDKHRHENPKVLMCVTAERGVGVGLSIGEHIFYGANSGISATHMILDANGPKCSCGNCGCWDIMASTETMLEKIYEKDMTLKDLDYASVVKLYDDGNKSVRDIVENYTGYWMSVGLRNAINCYNPDCVVLVGAPFIDFPIIAQRCKEEVSKMPNIAARKASLVVEDKDDDIFLHSAASIVFSRFFTSKYHNSLACQLNR